MFFAVLLAGLLASSGAWAEYDWSPGKFANDGTVGKDRRLNKVYTKDLDISGDLTTGEGGTISPYGTQLVAGVVQLNNYNQLTQISSGNTVYVLDLTTGNQVEVDAQAIYASCDPIGTTGATEFKKNFAGVSIIATMPTAANNKTKFSVQKMDSSVTAFTLWVPQTSGVTALCNLWATYPVTQSGDSVWAGASSVSDFACAKQFDRREYQLNYNSGVSITPVSILNYKMLVLNFYELLEGQAKRLLALVDKAVLRERDWTL